MSEQQLQFDLFISYRREGGEVMGRLIFEMLRDQYNIFFDHESLTSGRFDTKLLGIIEKCSDFLVILSPGCFGRCKNPGDWFMQEISCALKNNKNIILLMMRDFAMPTGRELLELPEEIQALVKYNAYSIDIAYLDGVIARVAHDIRAPKKQQGVTLASLADWRSFAGRLADPSIAEVLPTEVKSNILRSAITAFLDEYNGKILNSILDRMSGRTSNVRTKYRYEVEIDRGYDFCLIDVDENKYNELSESFAHHKKFLEGAPDKNFWISFATNLDELDSALRDENFFFSENLMIDAEDMHSLSSLSENEKQEFYQSVMRVKININGKILTPARVLINESGIFGQYEITDELLARSETFDVKIRFRIPQKKGNTYFFASINDPTYSPVIRFTYPEDAFDVQMVPFINRSVTAKEARIFDGLCELSIEDEWVIPVSGAIFIIAEKP